jgi:hypothetical protein
VLCNKIETNKQTNQPTNKQTNKQTNSSFSHSQTAEHDSSSAALPVTLCNTRLLQCTALMFVATNAVLQSEFPSLPAVLTNAKSVFDGLEVTCWPLVPKFAGSHPAEAVGFLGQKIS